MKSVQWFLTRSFLSFLYRYLGKLSPAPWRPPFLMNHDDLNNLGRGLQKKHSCNVILKSVQWFLIRTSLKFSIQIYRENEAHGPRVAHLSDIATADMQMLSNIFPILSSQLMKRSSFKQFLILKKNIYGMPVNGAWSFEQTLNGGQLGFTISTILAIFDLRVTLMLPTKFRVNWPFGSKEEAKNRFSRWLPWRPSWISDWHDFSYFSSTSHPNVS